MASQMKPRKKAKQLEPIVDDEEIGLDEPVEIETPNDEEATTELDFEPNYGTLIDSADNGDDWN